MDQWRMKEKLYLSESCPGERKQEFRGKRNAIPLEMSAKSLKIFTNCCCISLALFSCV